MGRVRSALALAVAGALSLFAVLATHEILVFGAPGHGIIGQPGCAASLCPAMSVVITGLVFKAIGAGLALGVLGMLLPGGPARLWGASLLWAGQYLWALVGIASAYRVHFGTTWRWWEPFTSLIWHPVATPALMIAGLCAFLALDRLARVT